MRAWGVKRSTRDGESKEVRDDLLCTCASPSPLPLLSSEFGIHLSSLNKLNASDGSFKLSGYISGPDVYTVRVYRPKLMDIPVNYEIRKKRYRAQSCKATLELPCPQPKLSGECTVREETRSSQNILWGSASEKHDAESTFRRSKVQVGKLMALSLIAQSVSTGNPETLCNPFHLMFYLQRMISWITSSVLQLAPVINQTAC